MSWLLDTSVLIGVESGRLAGAPTEDVAISVVTLAELEAGVLVAAESGVRARRLNTLRRARELAEPLQIDEDVASAFAALRVALFETGRRMPVNDAWIAASAIANDLGVCTQDDDFDGVPGLEVMRI